MDTPVSLLILGLGNATQGDEGLGPAAVDRLQRGWIAPAGVHVSGGGLPPGVETARAALLVDAFTADAPPGAFIRLDGEHVAPALSGRVPGLAARLLDRRLILLGLVPEIVGPHLGLSRPVAAGLEGLVRRVVLEARQLGHEFRPRPPRPRGGGPADREGR